MSGVTVLNVFYKIINELPHTEMGKAEMQSTMSKKQINSLTVRFSCAKAQDVKGDYFLDKSFLIVKRCLVIYVFVCVVRLT